MLYKGLVVEEQLSDVSLLNRLHIERVMLKPAVTGDNMEHHYLLYDLHRDDVLAIQAQLKPKGVACVGHHLSGMVLYHDAVFEVDPRAPSTWRDAMIYGTKLGLSGQQLTFDFSAFLDVPTRGSTLADYTDPLLRAIPMPIVTPRMRLRPWQEGDGVAFAEANHESWDDFHSTLAWATHYDTATNPSVQERNIRLQMAKFTTREEFAFVAEDALGNRYIGGCELYDIKWSVPSMRIGFYIRTSCTGQGYATDMLRALVVYAFKALGARKLMVAHAINNHASRRVIEKVGFRKTGIDHYGYKRHDGQLIDTVDYTLLSADHLKQDDVRWG